MESNVAVLEDTYLANSVKNALKRRVEAELELKALKGEAPEMFSRCTFSRSHGNISGNEGAANVFREMNPEQLAAVANRLLNA